MKTTRRINSIVRCTRIIAFGALILSGATVHSQTPTRPSQPLHIPQLLTGNHFEINLHKSSKSFWKGATTKTYAYNGESFWGPTLEFKQGESVSVNVRNELDEPTTTHWHGLHIPAGMDGGPHQLIGAGKTWSPSFKVKNNAGLYWYHPHAHETTQKQITYGAGGLIIIRDPAEAKLNLPRTYGVDDIPLVFTSRRFYQNNEFSFEGDNDKYGDYPLANGVMDAETTLPAQVVRLRILNCEIERGYDFGFSDNRTFYVIGTDGGLVEKPIPVKRMKLMVGERVELLVDLSNDKPGSALDMTTYNGGQPFGFPGGEPGTGRPNGSYLNNTTFRMLHINVGESKSNAVKDLPTALVKSESLKESEVSKERNVRISGGRPTFSFDDKPYAMHDVSQIVKLGSVEKWTVTNNNIFGHSFHIHDVQFRIVSRSNGPVEAYESGWKDTLYVPRGESVSFVTKFDDFASDTDAFMYHCHMSNHEDGGLMGEFLVTKDGKAPSLNLRDKQEHPVTESMQLAVSKSAGKRAAPIEARDTLNRIFSLVSVNKSKPVLLYFIEAQCPCSVDATPFFNQLQQRFGTDAQIVGIINASPAGASKWSRKVGVKFPVIPDERGQIIRAYGAERSLYSTLIAPGGVISKSYAGYGKDMLQEVNAKIAGMTKNQIAKLDLTKAPKRLLSGCSFTFGNVASSVPVKFSELPEIKDK